MIRTLSAILVAIHLQGCNFGQLGVIESKDVPVIRSVAIENDQFILSGENLASVDLARIEGSANQTFIIESRSPTQLVLNARSALSILTEGTFSFFVSSAYGATSFPVNFTISDSQVMSATLAGYSVGTASALVPADTVLQGFGKLEAQTNSLLSQGQWAKNSSNDISYSVGKVGLNIADPLYRFHIIDTSLDTAGSRFQFFNDYTISPASASNATYWAEKTQVSFNGEGNASNQVVGGEFLASRNANSTTTGKLGTITALTGNARNNAAGTLGAGFGVYGYTKTSAGTMTTATGGRFDVLTTGGATTTGYGVYIGSVQATTKYSLYSSDATAPSFFSGSVGLGIVPSTYKLDVNGDIRIASGKKLYIASTAVCDGTGCTAAPSDRRLKENIVPLTKSLDKILRVRPVSFDWKDKQTYRDDREIGLIAQEIEKIYPEVVRTDNKSGMKTVMYDKLVSPLIAALKEENEKVTHLEGEIHGLRKENEEMKAQLDRIERLLKKER